MEEMSDTHSAVSSNGALKAQYLIGDLGKENQSLLLLTHRQTDPRFGRGSSLIQYSSSEQTEKTTVSEVALQRHDALISYGDGLLTNRLLTSCSLQTPLLS